MDALICPCDTGKPYERCCGRFHDGRRVPTAAALMRSRYSAFALSLPEYLLLTWHPATRPHTVVLDDETKWTGLQIHDTELGQAWDQTGFVTYSASWVAPGKAGVLHERSRFVLDHGTWYYVDGVTS